MLTETATSFTITEAFAAITIAAIASDGYLAEEELDSILSTLNRMHLFQGHSEIAMRRLFDKLFSLLQTSGVSSLVESAQHSLPPDLRTSAFAVATDLILADGYVTEDEKNFLHHLHQALQIPEDLAWKIIDVMVIKNRG